MSEERLLAKTNRINLLFDFYGRLLTDKQRTFLSYYFHEDFSLGEIASEFEISRQAVYEHIKRAEITLEELETKLELLAKHEERGKLISQLESLLEGDSERMKNAIKDLVQRIYSID
ncbi:putative DNA-binding protein [Paenibacillus koleovorans]|uniref:putative DNA-binding protein n=1 Tax=Paenibacillus koleovorans TaxID=121608 RepID=UPI000FDA5532|nr:putative DNA-binding protein [Paenibacillus koleovorans]